MTRRKNGVGDVAFVWSGGAHEEGTQGREVTCGEEEEKEKEVKQKEKEECNKRRKRK